MVEVTAAPLRRIFDFEREIYRRCATTTPLPWGEAVARRDLPLVHDLNTVVVDTEPRSAAAVVAAAESLQEGLDHRRLRVEDVAATRRLLPHLGGWQRSRHLAMLLTRSPDRAADVGRTQVVDIDRFTHFDLAATAEEPWGGDTVSEQLAARLALYGEACELTCLLGEVDGEPAAGCVLLALGEVAQVDAVHVLSAFRGQGLGREITAAAVAEAERQGRSVIHLFADAHDWPRKLYERMGFDEIGGVDLFLRLLS